jgi:hypothetical protein
MATIPSSTTSIQDQVSASGAGADLVTVIAAVPTAADGKPALYSNIKALLADKGYSEGAEYAAYHFARTRRPVLFVGIPIVTQGVIGRLNTSGNAGSSVASIAAGAQGPLAETDGVLTVIKGGTVGTDQILLGLSLDGGRKTKTIRLGTATSYVIPYVSLTISLTVGTLVAGNTILTWHTTAPHWDQAGLALARAGLKAQLRQSRSWMVIGDMADGDDAADVLAEANSYETEQSRFVFARCSVRDRLPQAEMSHVTSRMSGTPTITFAEVGATGDTITRSSGSFVTDGFASGDTIRVAGAVASAGANNVVGVPAGIAATVLTLDTTDLVAEGPISGVSITSEPTLTFADNGAGEDTLTRNRGSWLNDGFRVGDSITITGTASNNVTKVITGVTATTINVATASFAAEVIGSSVVTIVAGESKAAWSAALDAEFEDVAAAPRIDLAKGRCRLPRASIDGWRFRRPASWLVSAIEYDAAHDVHIPTYRVADGSTGADLHDTAGNLVEWDEFVDGGDTTFTTLRSYPNDAGTFVSLSLTRANPDSLLSRTHNAAVAFLAQQVCDQEATRVIGQVLVLQDDGTAAPVSLSKIQEKVQGALRRVLTTDRGKGKGPRASSVSWTPATDDILNVPGAVLHGDLVLQLGGTIEHIETTVRVATGG